MPEITRSRQALRPAQAAKKLGISVPTLWRYCREKPNFPKPRKLSARVTVFDDAELDEILSGARSMVLEAA